MSTTPDERERNVLYLAILAIALVAAVYFALLVIGFLVRLLFIAAAVALGVMAWRAWRTGS